MGTSSLICVWYKGRFVVAQYTQFDGYPEGQGTKILEFLVKKGNIERLKAGLENIRVIEPGELEQIHEKIDQDGLARQLAGDPVPPPYMMIGSRGTEFDRLFPSLSHLTGGGILELIARSNPENPLPIDMDLGFGNNALFCEWAYCVDLDTGVFEIFCGCCPKNSPAGERFKSVGAENAPVPSLLLSFSFDNLPRSQRELVRIVNRTMKEGHSP